METLIGQGYSENSNKGKTSDLSTTTTFKQSDGANFVVNCTADSALNSTGTFPVGFTISVLNIGTHIITIDSMHDINPGQRGTYTFDGTEFQGGV